MSNIQHPISALKGGEFLIRDTNAEEIFIPEQASEEQQMIYQSCIDFLAQEVWPNLDKIDRQEDNITVKLLDKAAELGLLGLNVPEQYGGFEKDFVTGMLSTEAIGGGHSFAVSLAAHTGIGTLPILYYGNEAQKAKYLPKLANGQWKACYCLTEPGSGSDANSGKTKAVLSPDGKHYLLNGQKMWITNGPIADVVMVLAVTDPALGARGGATVFAVETRWDGFSAGKPEKKMGLHGSPTSLLNFDGVRVPKENIVGQLGLGFVTFMKTLDIGRVSLGAATLGGAQAALDAALRWVKVRSQFGRPIAHLQSIQFMLADMATEIEALRSLVYRTAWLVDNGQPFIKEAGMCKLMGSEIASRCIDRALQIHGALGLSRDFHLERGWRDARIAEIFEGTNEIQRIVIASELLQEVGVRIRP